MANISNKKEYSDEDFILHGKKVVVKPFVKSDINEYYIGWLNEYDDVRFSNKRFIKHKKESCLRYLNSFEGSSNLFMSIRLLLSDFMMGTLTAYVSNHHGTVDVLYYAKFSDV